MGKGRSLDVRNARARVMIRLGQTIYNGADLGVILGLKSSKKVISEMRTNKSILLRTSSMDFKASWSSSL